MDKKDIEIIKKSFWDYSIDNHEIEEKIEALNHGKVSDERFFIRILENFSWHFLIKLIPEKVLLNLLSDKILQKIRSKRRRENLANTKSILLDLPLPFPRWNNINNERSRHGLLSDRWYGVK